MSSVESRKPVTRMSRFSRLVQVFHFLTRKEKPNTSGFILIGAGLPRTGTNSTRQALVQLLDGACYHMVDCQQGMDREAEFWLKAAHHKKSSSVLPSEEWVNLLEARGYRAGVDYPLALFYKYC